ncbi:MAG: hypothetical protein EOO46_22395 [Flavobacterium sp.]|nr:MAG: hypothetical protein EOO46_22395 [Flavobacterium sp.]
MEQIQPVNSVDSFSQQLHNLVYLSAQINTEEYKIKGFEKSCESHGNVQIFKAEYNNIKEQIGLYAIDDSLGSKRNVLTSNINVAFESQKSNLEADKQNQVNTIKSIIDLEKRHLTDKISGLKQEKSVFYSLLNVNFLHKNKKVLQKKELFPIRPFFLQVTGQLFHPITKESICFTFAPLSLLKVWN